jgi:hypothetical protein
MTTGQRRRIEAFDRWVRRVRARAAERDDDDSLREQFEDGFTPEEAIEQEISEAQSQTMNPSAPTVVVQVDFQRRGHLKNIPGYRR